jgi:hypothetical protein
MKDEVDMESVVRRRGVAGKLLKRGVTTGKRDASQARASRNNDDIPQRDRLVPTPGTRKSVVTYRPSSASHHFCASAPLQRCIGRFYYRLLPAPPVAFSDDVIFKQEKDGDPSASKPFVTGLLDAFRGLNKRRPRQTTILSQI